MNKGDSRTSLQWIWGRTGDATDSFVVKLNGTEVARQTGTSYTVNSITDGDYQLEVSEKDQTGNASAFTAATKVTVDRVLPATPAPGASSPTRSAKPTWSWTSGAVGQFEYRLAQGSDPTGTGTAIAATNYTPSSNLADGSWYFQVREKDAADNWSLWSASAIVVIKASAPSAPSVSRNASPTNSPSWSWTSGGGGNGTFRFHWSGNASYLGEGSATSYAPNISDGSYNLCVSEKDVVGYGGESCVSISVDKTAPVITGMYPPDGFVTNKASVTVNYQKDGVSESFSCSLTDGSSKVCSKTVYDAAGNPAVVSGTIWSRQNVVFVKAGVTGGDGTSWDAAFGDIPSALSSLSGKTGRQEVWVSEGTYTGFIMSRTETSIYGGFDKSGYPNSTATRNLTTKVTRIRPDGQATAIVVDYETYTDPNIRDAIIDGLHINDETGQAIAVAHSDNTVFQNIWVERIQNTAGGAGVVAISTNGDAVFTNAYIRDNFSQSYTAVYLYSGGRASFTNSEITGNGLGSSWGSAGILDESGGSLKLKNVKLYKNQGGSNNYQAFNYNGGQFDISGCTVQGGRQGIYPTDDPNSSSVLWGSGNTTY